MHVLQVKQLFRADSQTVHILSNLFLLISNLHHCHYSQMFRPPSFKQSTPSCRTNMRQLLWREQVIILLIFIIIIIIIYMIIMIMMIISAWRESENSGQNPQCRT